MDCLSLRYFELRIRQPFNKLMEGNLSSNPSAKHASQMDTLDNPQSRYQKDNPPSPPLAQHHVIGVGEPKITLGRKDLSIISKMGLQNWQHKATFDFDLVSKI